MPYPRIPTRFLALCTGSLLAAHAHAYSVYVSSEKDNLITVIDGESLEKRGEAKVGQRPRGIALSLDNRLLYVCASDEDRIEVLNLETLKVTHTLPSGPDPELLDSCSRLLLSRHTQLKSFLASPSTVLFRFDVVRYFHVTRFQEVRQWMPPNGSSL